MSYDIIKYFIEHNGESKIEIYNNFKILYIQLLNAIDENKKLKNENEILKDKINMINNENHKLEDEQMKRDVFEIMKEVANSINK